MEIVDLNKIEELKEGNKTTLVMFSTEWCGECKMNKLLLEAIEENYKDILFVKIDVDEERLWADDGNDKYKIMSVPTFHIYKNGEPTREHVGFVSEHELKQFINNEI
jgi:thioredoxin 1